MTTFVSLAGRYLVLMPNNPRGGGVSRRVEGDERTELRDVMDQLQVPQGMSLIARTAAIGRNAEELQWDLNYLMQLWKAIDGAANQQKGAFLIYQEGSLVIRAIRDYFQPDIGEILIDTDDVYEQARQFMAHVMPGTVNRIKRYRDDVPLFSRFQIEHQIESAYSRQVILPSGGAIVIDHTEALVSVNVNSGRSTRGADIEETAYKTNLEAAEEVARQLRLRDLGGLIIIDFIDMESQRNQREVENRLRDGLRLDRARVQTGKISRFGLMELSRQRLRPALAETSYIPCPRCSGTGHIRSAESAALHILRILEEEAMKDNTATVHSQVPVDVATFLLNEKRTDIQAIELRHKVSIMLIPNVHLETPQHSIIRLRNDELNHDEVQQPSYKMVDVPSKETTKQTSIAGEVKSPRQEAAIKGITTSEPAPIVAEKTKGVVEKPAIGFIARILAWFHGIPEPAPTPTPVKKLRNNAQRDGQRDGRRGGRNNRRDDEVEAREPRATREARPAQISARDDNQKPREPKDAREPRRQRGEPRPERKDQVAIAPLAEEKTGIPANVETSDKVAADGSSTGTRRRGRRGARRDRGERSENPEEVNTAEALLALDAGDGSFNGYVTATVPSPEAKTEATLQLAPETVVEPAPEALVMATPIPVTSEPDGAPVLTTGVTSEIEAATLEVVSAPLVLETMKPVDHDEASATEPATVEHPAVIAMEPVFEIERALESSGLVMVETSGDKVKSWQTEGAAVEVAPRRKRPVAVAASDEPLVMVETSK